MIGPDRTLTRSAARRIKRRAHESRQKTAQWLATCQDDVAAGWERAACARAVASLLAPITVPIDEPEALRNAHWANLAVRLTNARRDLAHRRNVVRELALLASDHRWESLSRPVRALLTLAVQWSGQTAAQAWAGLPKPVAALESAA